MSSRPESHRGPAGFTLVELVIAMAVMVPILIAALSTSNVIGHTVSANDRNAEAMDHNRVLFQRLDQQLRPAVVSTLRTRADQQDVDEYTARAAAELAVDPTAHPFVPSLGEWIPPGSPPRPRPNVQFQCASGALSMNAAALTTVRELEFVLDPGETDNDLDDDGDGMVDEGRLDFLYEGVRHTLARDLEVCTFTMQGKIVTVELQLVRRDKAGRLHRTLLRHVFFPRNA